VRTDLYTPRDTVVHRLHPTVKLAGLAVGIALTFFGLAPGFQGLILVAFAAAALAARSLADTLRPWRFLLFIIAFTTLIWCVIGDPRFDAAPDLLRLGPLRVARPELAAAFGYGLRVTTIVLFGLLFLATTRIEEAIAALRAVGVPYVVAFTLGLAFRLVPLFLQSAASIVEAQRARGLDLESGGLRARLRKYVPVLVPIFMTSLRGADRMAIALEARGFRAGPRRTSYRRYALAARDAAAAAAIAAAFGAFYFLRTRGLATVAS